jgi:putative lipoprotein
MQTSQPLARAPRVRLDLDLPPGDAPPAEAVVHVIVEDVGEADVPAPPLLRRDFTGIRIDRHGAAPSLDLELPDLSGAITPAIRVHVDRSGSGAIEPGDLINAQRVEVPAAGQDRCRVPLIEVR